MEVDGAALAHFGGSPILATGTAAAARCGHNWVGRGPVFVFFLPLL